MANNATISWTDFTNLSALVNSTKDTLVKQNSFFHDLTGSKKGLSKNVTDIGFSCLKVKVTFEKNEISKNLKIDSKAKNGINIGNISNMGNSIISATVQHEHKDTIYSVQLSDAIKSPADLFGGTSTFGTVVRSQKASAKVTVTVHILMISFPN